MKNILFLALTISILSCKDTKKETTDYSKENLDITTSIYPEHISKVFDAHGGIDNWNTMKSLTFEMKLPKGKEVTTTDLKNRKSLIETDKFKIGFNGENVWLQQDALFFKKDPKFYYNLMFYFYAMPIVLADDGIEYGETEDLEFEGKSYPGVRISYKQGIGVSSKDEYYLHYDTETHQMAWLGYTVTYRSGEKSDNVKWIRYNDWMEVEGLKLPNSIPTFLLWS